MNPVLQPLYRFIVLLGDLRLDVSKFLGRGPRALISCDRE